MALSSPTGGRADGTERKSGEPLPGGLVCELGPMSAPHTPPLPRPGSPISMDTLLTHRAWVRRLARSLVRDDASADDVEQRTWLAALRRPPWDAATAQAWLAKVTRNEAFNARRADRRR